ncbi:conserved Plasmodium protein, unknown function [Plasmodium gallinaceum]|uniref:DIX domain-containing protein n=1 Tax=Plasmodium gallinaceum TaxID=5849 RepID=A0A1J1GX85_PLAGA|nr:conserved Plasmodium protein, unknown function [Plasmodium gallinaceum]CRG95632.1 conserved Plasmodium protein, unknown function [Plasmodium gallinaceum]
MDIFSLASNLQQIAIGGVNYVNNKLLKKNSFTKYNYVTYIIIGENENQPYDVNIFFLPFQNSNELKFKEFKEYFPFKGDIIFRFKIILTDLIEVINKGYRNNAPLLKQKEKEKNLTNHIISDEAEIKNILRQDNLNYIWIDINNDDAFIPLCHGKIVAKVLFINHKNYRNFNEIYFNNYKYNNSPIYIMNEKHLCSYEFIKKEDKSIKCSIDSNDIINSEDFDGDNKKTSSQSNFMNFSYSNDTEEFENSMYYNDDLKKKNGNKFYIKKNNKRDILSEDCVKKENISGIIESENEHFFQNEDSDNNYLKKRSNSDILNESYEGNITTEINQNNNENNKNEKNFEKLFQNKDINENILEKVNLSSSKGLSLMYKNNSNNNYDDLINNNVIKKDEKFLKAKLNNRLEELKESRYQEQEKFKEKILISENVKKQIVKWSKNSDDTYKDIKVMLSTLNDVLWENAEWKNVSMSDLISNTKMVKKTYKNAILLCHPDKHRNKPLEQVLRAEMIFQALNNSYKLKKNM